MYAMYLRKSRADKEAELRGAGETLSRHRETLFALAERNGHRIGRVYAEIVSGETIANRPQMQRLLHDLAEGLWDGVYVMEVERLARGDTLEQGRVAQVFRLAGASIVTPNKTYDAGNEFDEEVLEFGLFLSRREYKTINRRIQAGRRASLREGKFIGSVPPFGYTRVKIPKDKGYTLLEDPTEAKTVREIFADFATGTSVREISAKTGFSPCRIYRILRNPVYIGRIRWGQTRQEKKLGEGGEIVTKRRAGEGEEYAGLHEGIVGEELFERVQKRLGKRRKGEETSFCEGVLYCALCGAKMRLLPEDSSHKARFSCGTKGCKTVRSNAELVEERLTELLFPKEEDATRKKAYIASFIEKVLYEKSEKGGECHLTVIFRENVAENVCDEFFSLPIFPQNPCAAGNSGGSTSVSTNSCSCRSCGN